MTNIYEQFAQDDTNNIIEKAPSQNIGKDANLNPPTFNVYEELIQQDNLEQDLQVKKSLQAVMAKDPDMVGEGLQLTKELGLSKNFALDSDEAIKLMKERKKMKNLEDLKLAKKNPVLYKQLTDPTFAALAYDNLPNLANSENLWNSLISLPENGWQGVRKGILSRELGMIANRLRANQVKFISVEKGFDLNYVPTEQDKKDYERIKEINETIANYDADGVGLVEGSGYFFGQYGSSIPEAALTGLATYKTKLEAGAALGAAFGGGTDNSMMGRFVFGTGGATIGNFIGLFTGWNAFQNKLTYDTFQIEGGHSWLELRDRGLSMEEARIASNAVGTVNAIIEKIGLGFIANPYAKALAGAKGTFVRSGLANTPFVKSLQKRISRQVVKNTLGKNAKKLTWNGIARTFAKDYGILLGTETFQEVLQEAVSITAVNVSAEFSEDEIQTISAEQIGDRLASTFTETFKSMILFGLIGPGISYSSNINKAEKAKNNTAILKKITEISQDDITKNRDKEQYKDYEQSLGNKAGIKDFYFNAKTFQQELDNNNISNEQLNLFSPELAKELENAKKEGFAGKLIKIPTGQYIAEISGTELGNSLFPHLKPGEKEYSQTEMVQFYKDQPELFAAVKQEFDQRKINLQKFTRESRAVKKQIKKQLTNLGYSESESRDMAALPQAVAEAFSKSLGITPLEFLNRFQYNIQGESTNISTFNKQFFNQDGTIKTETQLFKNWFRNSKLTNDDGTPQVMYHGTIDSFDYFDLNHPDRYDTGFAGTGVYLTPDKRLAERYARQKSVRTGATAKDRKVMPLYARLENPKIEDLRELKFNIKQGGRALADGYRDKLIAEGHDGVILKNEAGETVEVVIFDVNGVKSVDNNGNWSNEINNIYEQQALKTFEQKATQKQGKPVSEEVFQLAKIVENFNFATSKPFATNRDFKLEIQNRIQAAAKKARVNLADFSAETEKYLVKTLLEDARFALTENANAVGWYDEKVSKAVRILSKIYPKVATDKRHEFVFKWALAATSNGIKVDKNYEYAADVYNKFLQSEQELGEGKGRLPEKMLNAQGEKTGGTARAAMEKSFKILNLLFDKKPFAELEEFMRTMHTVREVHEFVGTYKNGRQIKVGGGYGLDEQVYGAAIMGPKIGNGFFANLNGNYDQLTLDRWAMRTWGRMTGTLVLNKQKQAKIKRGQIKQIIKALTKEQKKAFETIIGRKLTVGDLDQLAIDIEKASTTEENRDLMAEIARFDKDPKHKEIYIEIGGKPKSNDATVSLGDYLRKRGNLLAKDNDGQKEAPSGAPERRNIEKVFAQVLEVLQKDYPSLTMADLQALVWYPEKKLYDSAKLKETEIETGYEDNEAPDYANAAVEFAATMGISNEDIQNAIQEVNDELQSTQQSTGTQPDDGGRGTVGTDDGTFQQQGNIDESTGLTINPDETVTVFHHTNRRAAESIKATGQLKSAGEPDVYVTTRAIADTGYGDTAVAIRVEPSRLSLDDEFPNGRRDYRLSVGKPRGSIQVKVGEYFEQQASDGARGRFEPATLTTILTEKADFSTFAHETAHYMLTVLENIVSADSAPQELTADFNTLLKFWGVKDLKTWKTFDLDKKREYHESFAYNFELYLSEGKIPSPDKKIISMFRKFSRFIKDVYKDVSTRLNELYKRETGKDLPILTNDVRNVMDRMLATDEQIVQANLIYDLKAMFQTQEQSGMNNAEWAEYTAALQEAEDESLEIMTQQSMRQVRWLNNKRDKVKNELDKKILKIRKTVEAEVTEEIKQDKRYRLKTYLKRGEITNENGETTKVKGNYKISIDSIKNLTPFYDEASFKQEIKELGTGQYGMVAKKGVPVQLIADLFGFKNPQIMIDALLELQPIEDAITERTDQRMLEEYSDLVDPKQLELQVQEAIHNEARARFVAVELNTLSKAMRPVRYQVAAAKQVAQDILADKKLSEIKPSEFTRAEARALKEAEIAMKAGDTKEAIKAKRSQLINNQLAKEAIEIQKEYNKAIKVDFIKFFKSDSKLTSKSSPRNMDIISAGRVILSSYNIGPKVKDINVFTEDLRKYDEQLYAELEPMILDAQASNGRKDITDLTYEDFQNLYDLTESLWHQSRRSEQIKLEGKLLDLQPVIDTLVNRMDLMIQRNERLRTLEATPIGTTKAVPKSYLRNKDLLAFGAKLRRMESWVDSMDGATKLKKGTGSAVLELEGGKLGKFYNTLWFPMKSALDEYRVQQTIFTKQYSNLVAGVDFGNAEITANEFQFVSEESEAYTFGSESNGRGKVELLGAMLHTGNESNLRKLLLGRKWGKLNEDGTLDRSSWDAFETRMKNEGHLTKQDYIFLQAVWDLNEKMLPLLQRAHKDTEGYYFKTVKASPILNRFGEFRGGYVPAKGDPYMTDVNVKEEINILKSEFKNSLPKVESGMTKERVEKFAQPLSLHLGFMTKHIDDTLRYAYIQPVLQDTLKILNNKDFKKKLGVIDPTVLDEMIMPWLKAAASQKTYTASGFGARFDRILATIKRRTGIGIMFANIGNAFQQLTGLFPALIKVKPRHLKDGLITYMKNRESTNQQIAEMSPFMADRQKNLIFDIQDRLNELIINPNNFQKMESWGKQHGYFLQQTFQGITDSIVWMGTYNQVHETMSKDMSSDEVMREAIKQADANVRLTQDSLLPEDRAAFQNMNPIVQSLTQFSGYFNMIANLSFTQHQKLVKDDLGFNNKGKNTEQFVYMYLYTIVMPAVIAGIIMRGLGGRIEDEEDDGFIIDDMASAAFGDIVNYTAGLVPIAGQALLIPINQFNDKPWDDDIVSSPGIEALTDSLTALPKLVETIFTDGELTGKQIRDVSTMVTLGSGMPVTPLGKLLGYLRDVERGYVKPKGPIDFVRGLITGKAGVGKK